MKDLKWRIVVEGLWLAGGLFLGAYLWIMVASLHEGQVDEYWAAHGVPPTHLTDPSNLMPWLTLGPLVALLCVRLAVWAVRTRRLPISA
jgi:hypothetical protein